MLHVITHNNVDLTSGTVSGNGEVFYSLLNELNSEVYFKGFSIKHVARGKEEYIVNNRKYIVKQGEYLLGNNFSEGKVKIGSDEIVKGICININADILSEVVAAYVRPDTPELDLSLDNFFRTREFYESKYSAESTHLGHKLQHFASICETEDNISHEQEKLFYYSLSESIVHDHVKLLGKLNSIDAIKSVTKKELFRKIEKAKEFIDCNYTQEIKIEKIAQFVGLSEFHFYRLFKSLHSCTPHQYIVNKRLEQSRIMLSKREGSALEIATICGFYDVSAFSNAFKKHFGYSPTKIKFN